MGHQRGTSAMSDVGFGGVCEYVYFWVWKLWINVYWLRSGLHVS